MALQAIVNGARGLVFFGGHLTQVCTPGRCEGRVELDVLGTRAAPARRRALLRRRPARARRAEGEGNRQGRCRGRRGGDPPGRPHAVGGRGAPRRRHVDRGLHRPPEQGTTARSSPGARCSRSGCRSRRRRRSAVTARSSARSPSRIAAFATGSGRSTPGSTASGSERTLGRGRSRGASRRRGRSTIPRLGARRSLSLASDETHRLPQPRCRDARRSDAGACKG